MMEIYLPDGWKIQSLAKLVDVRDGTHETPYYIENGYPLITSKNLVDGKISFKDVQYISEYDYIAINKRSKVDKGDILYAMIGTIGNPVIIEDEPRYAIKNVALFKFTKTTFCNRYFFYLLNSPFVLAQIQAETQGGIQSFVSLNVLRKLQIPYPEDVKKQEAIANKLTLKLTFVEQMRQSALKQKEAVEAIQGALLRDLFPYKEGDELPKDWKWEKLGNIFEDVKNQVQPFEEEFKKLPFVGLENVISNTREYTDEEYNEPASNCFKFDETQILYGKLRPYLNKVFLPESQGKSSMELIPLKPKNTYSREFLAAILQSEAVIGDTVKFSTGGRMPRADISKLKKLDVAIPSDIVKCNTIGLDIANKINKLIQLTKKTKEQLVAIEAIPAAILREVFQFE